MKTTFSQKNKSAGIRIVSFVLYTFLGYFCIGLPLAVLPIFIHKTLGYSALIAGIVISLQYATTFVVRGYAGTIVDTKGPKLAVSVGMLSFIISGILLFAAFMFSQSPAVSIVLLILSRLVTGCGEGMIGASPINWAMIVVGKEHTPTIISYNGIASYGALALGAPLGVVIQQHLGAEFIGILIILTGLAGGLAVIRKQPVKANVAGAESKSFFRVLLLVSPFGITLGLAAIGFGGISNFITLYYDFYHWKSAALSLSAFSAMFILARFVFSNAITRYGGVTTAIVCLITETAGLLLLFFAGSPIVALAGAALTGFGFSLVFPALGVEAVNKAPAGNAGAALAAYGLFIDISLGVTGPLAGSVIQYFGMEYLFLFCSIMAVFGILILLLLKKLKKRHLTVSA